MSTPFIPMKPTEAIRTPLDNVYPGLRIVDKFHPPGVNYPDPSHEQIAGIKGQSGVVTTLIGKRPIV